MLCLSMSTWLVLYTLTHTQMYREKLSSARCGLVTIVEQFDKVIRLGPGRVRKRVDIHCEKKNYIGEKTNNGPRINVADDRSRH